MNHCHAAGSSSCAVRPTDCPAGPPSPRLSLRLPSPSARARSPAPSEVSPWVSNVANSKPGQWAQRESKRVAEWVAKTYREEGLSGFARYTNLDPSNPLIYRTGEKLVRGAGKGGSKVRQLFSPKARPSGQISTTNSANAATANDGTRSLWTGRAKAVVQSEDTWDFTRATFDSSYGDYSGVANSVLQRGARRAVNSLDDGPWREVAGATYNLTTSVSERSSVKKIAETAKKPFNFGKQQSSKPDDAGRIEAGEAAGPVSRTHTAEPQRDMCLTDSPAAILNYLRGTPVDTGAGPTR